MEAFGSAGGWKARVNVVVLKVESPSVFLVREAPGPHMSSYGRDFLRLEADINNSMEKLALEPYYPLLPEIGSVVLVKKPKTRKWYRGRISNVYDTKEDTKEGTKVEVTLVDYGETVVVDQQQLRKLFHRRLLEVPFQCIRFSLSQLRPIRLTIDRETIKTKFITSHFWDTAAGLYVKSAMERAGSVHVQVLGRTSSGDLAGKLFIECNETTMCLNEELVKLNFAIQEVEDSGEATSHKNEILLGTDKGGQPLGKEPRLECTAPQIYFGTEKDVTTAALKDVHKNVLEFASQEHCFPVKVSWQEAGVSPPSSVSASFASSPTQRSSVSASISLGAVSTGSDTRPTLPGLGRGLALKLRPSPLQLSTVEGSTNKLIKESRPVLGLAQDVASCSRTAVGTTPEGLSSHETAGATDSANSMAAAPGTLPLHTPQQILVSDCVPTFTASTPCVTGTSHIGEHKARGRARTTQPYLVCKAQFDASIKVRPPRTVNSDYSGKVQEAHAVAKAKTPVQNKASEFCAPDTGSPGKIDLSLYRSVGRGAALQLKPTSRVLSQHASSLPLESVNTQQNESLKLCKSTESKPSPTCVDLDHNSSCTVSKSQMLQDFLQKWKSSSNGSPSQNNYPLKSQAGEDDASPALQKQACHLQSTSHQAPVNVRQGLENLQLDEFQGYSELQPDLDPSGYFSGPVDFITNYNSCNLTESAYLNLRVLCHGLRVPSAQQHLDETMICGALKSNLRSQGFRAPTPIQSVVWPAVEFGRNVVAVGAAHSGKTLAYLIPLVSRILTECDYRLLPKGVGPLMLILASTWKGASRIYEQIKLLTAGTVGPRCTVLYAGGSEKKEEEIVNGCEILVATPNSFLRYLENYKGQIVNLRRCCHLVLDDGERLLDKYAPEVAKVLNEFWNSLAYRSPKIRIEQIIVCSTMWTKCLDLFLHKLLADRSPLVIFSSFFEAAIYAQVQTITHYAELRMHQGILLDILEGNKSQRVVICTSTRETAIALNRLLSLACVYSLLLHDQLPMARISEVSREWMGENTRIQTPVLVVQDNVLCLAKIRDATVLVHYDMPTISKSTFGFRYSCLASNMRSFRAKDNISLPAEGPVAHMILSSNNSKPSLQLVEFLTKCGSSVPDKLVELAAQKQSEVSTNAEVALCPNLKAFGHCEQPAGEKRCCYRHRILPPVDDSPVWSDLPSEGQVLIVVIRVISASHFYAWILQEWNTPSGSPTGTKAEVKEHVELQEAMLALNDYLSQSRNCIHLGEKAVPNVGQVYALEVSIGHFRRVLVTSLVPGESAPGRVTVSHIDYGDQSTVATTRLVELPQRFSELRPFLVEVYCCGIQPQDRDISWTCQADLKTYNCFSRKELCGKVMLRLGNTLWMHPLVMREKLAFVSAEVTLGSVSRTLIKEGLACTNENHLKSLRAMAADAGISVPLLPAGKGERSDNDSDDAIVNNLCSSYLDSRDFNHVYLWKVISPSHFYVQTLKLSSCLDQLENDIQKAVERQQVGKLRAVRIGVCCLARYSNGRWYRGEVLKIHDDKVVDIFFSDYGDTETCSRDELLEPAPWMMLLPYQGISCCLAGIGPQAEEWSPTAQSLLEDFGYDDSDVNRILCLRVARKRAGTRPGNNHYEVFLFDVCHGGRTSIGDLLVEKGLAVRTQLPELDFDIDVPHVASFQQNVCGPSNDTDDSDSDDSECKRNLEEHMYKVFSEICDQLLAPATAKVMEELPFSSDMSECDLSQGQSVDAPSAQFHQHASKETAPERSTVQKKSEDRIAKDIPTLESVFKTPSSRQAPISWWQDDCFVHVDILVASAEAYECHVSATSLVCRVYTAELEYLVHEQLFAAILPKKAQLVMKTQCLNVTLEKAQSKLYWDFLTGYRRKSSHIHYDLEHLVVSDDEDDYVNFCKAYKDPDFTGYERPKEILPYDPVAHEERLTEIKGGEDEDSDSSEDMFSDRDPNNIFEGWRI